MTGGNDAGAAPADGRFVVSADGARWIASGALTFANAAATLGRARALPLPQGGIVDLAGLGAVDSSAVAVLLALKRGAAARGQALVFAAVPASLASLASLYGVEEILGIRRS